MRHYFAKHGYVAMTNSDSTNSGRDHRRQEKVRQILAAASQVFFEDGFSAASVDRIVDIARVSKRTLYNYYKSKDEIFVEVMQKQLEAIYEHFEPAHLQGLSLKQQLTHLGVQMLKLSNAEATLNLFRIMAAESRRFPTLAREFIEQSLENVLGRITDICSREGQAAGLRIDRPQEAAEHFLDLLTGSNYHRVVFGTTEPLTDQAIEQRVTKAVDYFFKAFT